MATTRLCQTAESREADRPPVRLTYLVKQTELAIRSEIDRIVRQFGLTAVQYTALSVLHRHPGTSSAQLARRSFVSAQAANEMVAALSRKGFIERRADTSNRRILEMYLTGSGSSVLAACDREVDELEAKMLSELSGSARGQLRGALETCVRSLSPETFSRHVDTEAPRPC